MSNDKTGVMNRVHNQEDMDPSRMYFYTDGSFKKNVGSWAVAGLVHGNGKWKKIFSAMEENIPATSSTQMELHAISQALTAYQSNFPDCKPIFRSDDQGLLKLINRYLGTYPPRFSGDIHEKSCIARREDIRSGKYRKDIKEDYDNLFDTLDRLAKNLNHHEDGLNFEWVCRSHDEYIQHTDNLARTVNSEINRFPT